MTSTSFAARPRDTRDTRESRDARDASAGTQPPSVEAQNGKGDNNNHTRNNSSDTVLHAHRQNHNSSKLPAFRFVDLRKDRISLPSLQQPTPLAPVVDCDTADPRHSPAQHGLPHHSSAQTLPDRTASLEPKQAGGATRTRSLKFHLPSTAAPTDSPPASKRPKSFPVNNAPATESPLSPVAAIPAVKRRLTESAVKELVQGRRELPQPKTSDKTSRPPVSSASHKLLNTLDTANTANTASAASAASTSGGRAVIPPIRAFRSSGSRKGPALDMPARQDSYDEEVGAFNPRDRTLRTLEGQRDDDFSHLAPFESGEMTTTTDNDNTADIFMKIAREDPPPRAAERQPTAAEPSTIVSSSGLGRGAPDTMANISQSRIVRTSHRRPLSTTVPAHEVPSPPQVSRRLSDQRDNSRTRHAVDSPTTQPSTRESPYRASGRENVPLITTTAENSSRTQQPPQQGRTPPRPPPVTPRQISFKDSFAESSSAYQRRRQSLTENNSLSGSRATPQYRSPNFALAQSRTYHSSPLVPKSANVQADAPQNSDANHGVEGTESSSSTAAPSTVWDELDDLKSRIHRLERTGKMPSTSGGAMSRSSEERPRTATTNATTVSASPKRGSGTGPPQVEVPSLPVMPRETQPLLLSALGKTRELVSPEVFGAIESAATDALALSSMIGTVGQPGPISSSASTIGGYNGGITDRQLRKKADSVCRSLTELCLALADPTGQQKQPQPPTLAPEPEPLLSPTSTNATLHAATPQRRPSAIAEILAKASTSDRAPTSLEQKRKTMLASISLPTSRYATAPSTPLEPSAGRKSSLLLARIRRTTGTEEAEEMPQAGRRSSLLLRSRRTGSEEPEETREGRKTSLLLRTRKTLEEEDESRFRVPSRAITEVNSLRPVPRDLAHPATTQTPAEISPTTSAVLPRRRLIPSAISTRFAAAAPAASAPTTPARKYLERGSTAQDRGTPQERGPYLERSVHQERGSHLERSVQQERGPYLERNVHQERGPINSISERLAEERGQPQQRQISLGQSVLGRANSLGRRTREINSLRS